MCYQDYDAQYLAEIGSIPDALVLFCVATYGEGEPTDNARDFHDWLKEAEKENSVSLSNLKYSVCDQITRGFLTCFYRYSVWATRHTSISTMWLVSLIRHFTSLERSVYLSVERVMMMLSKIFPYFRFSDHSVWKMISLPGKIICGPPCVSPSVCRLVMMLSMVRACAVFSSVSFRQYSMNTGPFPSEKVFAGEIATLKSFETQKRYLIYYYYYFYYYIL
jgi:hypothetical protein